MMEGRLKSEVARHVYHALLAAGELACTLQAGATTHLAKQGRDFATEADLAVQRLLVKSLQQTLPGLHIVGEEDSVHELRAEEFLVIDPIDGTFLYSVGSDAWGITIALIAEGRPQCGFLYQPARQRMIYAERGHGTYLNGRRLQLDPSAKLSDSIIALVQGCWNTVDELHQVNVPLSNSALVALCPGSAVDAGFELLQGVCKAYLNYRGNIWDFAGLAIAVEEAGGVVTSPGGHPRSWDAISVPCLFSCSATLQQEITALLPDAFRL